MRTYLILALLFTTVLCATYISANTGNDESGDGKEDNPFQSFSQAFNSSTGSSSLEIYVYPGVYGGANNTGLTYDGALTIYWIKNDSAATGDPTSVTFDCTSASGVSCLSSGTSITISGLDDSGNPQIIFSDCSTCLTLNKTGSDRESDYILEITGVTFSEVTQYAIYASDIYSAEIKNSSFSDILGSDGLSLVNLINLANDITIESCSFHSLNQNVLTLFNISTAELNYNNFTNSYVFIQGVDIEDSQVVIDSNQIIASPTGSAADYAVNLWFGTFTIKDSKINTGNGVGAVKVYSSATTSIINTSLAGGSAIDGGSLYFQNVTTVTISENSILNANTASHFGGAIFLYNSSLHVDSSNFTNNVALNGAAIGCQGNETVYYDNTTVVFQGNTNTQPQGGSDIQDTCAKQIQSFQSSLVVSSLDNSSNAWIWILVSIAIVVVVLIIIAVVVFVVYQRKRQSYTRMD